MQNIVSLIGLFCKRDLSYFQYTTDIKATGYGLATSSRLLKILGLFCRISSLFVYTHISCYREWICDWDIYESQTHSQRCVIYISVTNSFKRYVWMCEYQCVNIKSMCECLSQIHSKDMWPISQSQRHVTWLSYTWGISTRHMSSQRHVTCIYTHILLQGMNLV